MPEDGRSEEGSSVKNQYLAAVVANIIAFGFGCSIGWPSPNLPHLTGPDTVLEWPLTASEASWIASILCVGGFLGTWSFGWVSDIYGRRTLAMVAAIPLFLSWVLKLAWKSANGLLVARFLAGLGGTGSYILAPIYSIEIASRTTRGALGSLMVFFFNSGVVFMYIIGAYLSYDTTLIIMMIIPIMSFVLMYRMPETPIFLLRQNREKEATEAIAWLRGENLNSPVVKNVLSSIKYDIALAKSCCPVKSVEDKFTEKTMDSNGNMDSDEISPSKLLFKSVPTRRAFFVCISLVGVQLFTGNFAIMTYSNDIFLQAGSNLSANVNTIIVGVLKLIGSVVASSLIEKTGRRVLLISSCAAQAISMLGIGIYFYMKNQDMNVSDIMWIPVTSLSVAVFTYSVGIGPVPYLLPSETLIVQVRGVATSIIYLMGWVASFLMAQFYTSFVDLLGIHVLFWSFAAVGALGVIITVFFLPETKGMPLETIISYYKGENIKDRSLNARNEQKELI